MNQRIANAISDPNTIFFIFPTPKLKAILMEDSHPMSKSLPYMVKTRLLGGQTYPIANEMVLKFLKGELDVKNHWLLSNCDIRVVQNSDSQMIYDLSVEANSNKG